MKPCLGHTEPDYFGTVLGTGMQRYYAPTGIEGLAKEDGERLDLLAVTASEPGTGQFKRFIAACKAEYAQINILEVSNAMLEATLQRWGWRYVEEQMPWGEMVTGYRYGAELTEDSGTAIRTLQKPSPDCSKSPSECPHSSDSSPADPKEAK